MMWNLRQDGTGGQYYKSYGKGHGEYDTYIGLAEAILSRAIKDYVFAYRSGDYCGICELNTFFYSEYCYLICSVEGDVLIERAKRQAIEQSNRVKQG